MSVISPGMYREMHESDSWEELARERSRLVRRLRHFELHCDELLGDGRVMDPGPDVFYQCELEFLRELCDLTLRAMRRETGLADLFGDEVTTAPSSPSTGKPSSSKGRDEIQVRMRERHLQHL